MTLNIFYFEIITSLQNDCKNSTEKSYVAFTRIYRVLTFSQFKTVLKSSLGDSGKMSAIFTRSPQCS